MKYINNEYNYKNEQIKKSSFSLREKLDFYLLSLKNKVFKTEWFNMLLSIFFTPFYSVLFIKDINRKKIKTYFSSENRNKLLFPIGTGFLYTVETILLFYALNTITLSYYTVLRSI
jgi:hypothetical protein